MHPRFTQRYDLAIRDRAALAFGADPEELVALPGFENFVYEFTSLEDQDLILRVAHSVRRSLEQTQAELDWILHLSSHRVPVSRPIPSGRGRWVERFEDGAGEYFVAVAFERAPGEVLEDRPAMRRAHWGPALFETWGGVVGSMHQHSADYHPPAGHARRPAWHEYDVVDAGKLIPAEETQVIERSRALVERLRQWPVDPGSYGLIHADLTERNFCYDQGRVTVFDFDNCEYAWYAKDIAVALYYVVNRAAPEERAEVAAAFLEGFLGGYRQVRPLPRGALAALPELLRLQRLMNYALFHQLKKGGELSDEDRETWTKSRAAIEADTPIVALSIETL